MNQSQRKVLICVAVVVCLMLLFPPLKNRVFDDGYGFLFARGNRSVNIGLLFTQWIAVGIAGAVAWVLVREKP